MLSDLGDRETEVWACLQRVTDPELDEPITSMGFVETVAVHRGGRIVEVEFRLPTYWCSPNFAYLMASDIRTEVEKLIWVERAAVQLNDHCFADRINSGVNSSSSFDAVFSDFSSGESLDAMRLKFLEKAFLRRQETLLLALQKQSFTHAAIVEMSLGEFDLLEFAEDEEKKQKPRYRELIISLGLATEKSDIVFPSWDGKKLSVDDFSQYLSQCRAVRINMDFNGALCRGLKDARYREHRIDPKSATPITFIRNAGKMDAH